MLPTLLRELAPQVLAAVARRFRDFAAAEDAVQEALLSASVQWPVEGLPGNPRAWLISVAARRMTDTIRSDSARRRREEESMSSRGYAMPAASSDQDDTLTLLVMCCHPALSTASAIALTLRAVGGLTTAAIARAFLVPESTMAQRISRAKQTIRDSGIPFELPERAEYQQRLRAVLHVLYLIFNEGYTASDGDGLQRADLAAEAIRLARLLPLDGDVSGLLALMLLTDARRAARTGPMGEAIPLDRQDRSLWDRAKIAEGRRLLEKASGPYYLQAAIAAEHDADATDWRRILALYDLLREAQPSAIIELNRAVAVAMVEGAENGLEELAKLDQLRAHFRFAAVRAHLREMAGDRTGAIDDFLAAAKGTSNTAERNFLMAQAARLRG